MAFSEIYSNYLCTIYTAPCLMFLMRADTLRGQVEEGWALEMESFLGPVKWHRADRVALFGAQKLKFSLIMSIITSNFRKNAEMNIVTQLQKRTFSFQPKVPHLSSEIRKTEAD